MPEEGQKNDSSQNTKNQKQEKITSMDIYKSLWKCRDFELDHLWQRSVFLTAFLVMCFTGYGAVLLQIFKFVQKERFDTLFPWLNFTELAIAFIGVILSVMWIMMSKGSKAWYEQYEQTIVKIETNEKYSEVMPDMWNDRVMHGHLQAPPVVHDCLFNPRAGRYSVSRINIGIGQLSLAIWIFLLLAHMVFFLCNVKYADDHTIQLINLPVSIVFLLKLLISLIMVVSIIFWICKGIPWLRSGTIKSEEEIKREDGTE